MLDRKTFFDRIRPLFGGTISQSQVDGINVMLDEWEARHPDGDLRWLADMLATAKWETAHTMQPIREYGLGAGHPYGVPDPETGQTYYGRGLVQLTWKYNYQSLGAKLGVDLVHQPDLALDSKIATDILFVGMEGGLFSPPHSLPRYFNGEWEDWINARKIINGLDHASQIAGIGRAFLAALQ